MYNPEVADPYLVVKALLIRRCLTISPERGALVVTDPSPLLPPVGVNLTFGKFKQGSQPLLKVPFGITLEEAVWFLLNPGELPPNPVWTKERESISSILIVPRCLRTTPNPYTTHQEVSGFSYTTSPLGPEVSYTTQVHSSPSSGSAMPRNSWLSRELITKIHHRFGLCDVSQVLVDREKGTTLPDGLPDLPWLPSWFTVHTVAGILASKPKRSMGRPRSEDLSLTPSQVGHPGIERTRSGKYRGRITSQGGKAVVTSSFATLEEAISARNALEDSK